LELISPYADIWSISLDSSSCDLWLAYHDGSGNTTGFSNYDGNSFTHFSTPNGGDVFEVLPGTAGDIWVASSSNGLGHFDGDAWTWYNESNSPLSNYVTDILFDHEGRLWVSTKNNGISVLNGGIWQTFNPSNSPVQEDILWLFIDHSGAVWAWNNGNPLRFDGTDWTPFYVNAGLEYDVIYSMAEDLNGKLWFGSYNAVYEYDGNGFITHDIENSNMGANLTFNIKVDAYNNKWLIHNAGISVYNENGITNLPIEPPVSTTSTSHVAVEQFKVLIYPNPNSGSFLVETSSDGPFTARVFDLSGHLVNTVLSNGKSKEIKGLKTGLYFVEILQGGEVAHSKVVVGQ
jgi:hypothetical protein